MTPGHILVVVGRFCSRVVEEIAGNGFFPHQVPAEDLLVMNHCPQGKCFLLSARLWPRIRHRMYSTYLQCFVKSHT